MKCLALTAAGIVTAALVLPLTTISADHPGDFDCPNFSSQAAAQAHLRAHPSDPDELDRDGNGVACENNPAPRDLTPVVRTGATAIPAATVVPTPALQAQPVFTVVIPKEILSGRTAAGETLGQVYGTMTAYVGETPCAVSDLAEAARRQEDAVLRIGESDGECRREGATVCFTIGEAGQGRLRERFEIRLGTAVLLTRLGVEPPALLLGPGPLPPPVRGCTGGSPAPFPVIATATAVPTSRPTITSPRTGDAGLTSSDKGGNMPSAAIASVVVVSTMGLLSLGAIKRIPRG